MNQEERRKYLINALISENKLYSGFAVPLSEKEQKELLRALMNVRHPSPLSKEYIEIESEYLRAETASKGITHMSDLDPVDGDLYLWQGDITTLECDAIVNAANSGMLGCFRPLHNCVDNCIHSAAGLRLRNFCSEIMEKQGYEEPTGCAKITPAYNLPCKYVIHTVGPIVSGRLTDKHCEQLASCYTSCLKLAGENLCESVAFCCISTGVFGFPQSEAAKIAVKTVKDHKEKSGSSIKVIFNVFKDEDLYIYRSVFKTV